MTTASPFHPGEQTVQARMGVRERIEAFARRVVRPYMPDEHRAFFGSLPFLVAAARDAQGRPWATLLAGPPGFVSSPDGETLDIDALPVAGDALQGSLTPGADLGLLGIEFATRRRNRVNGRVGVAPAVGLRLHVDQSFGNCPQHIRPRDWVNAPAGRRPKAQRADRLNAEQRRWIEGADTFFIATGHRGNGEAAAFGMDASHRGGEPGFVEVSDARTVVFPDYAGNNHFNTIGNLQLDPRAGLLFVDFRRGHLLQLTGRARIDWDSPAVAAVPGARRLVMVHVEAVVEVRWALPVVWHPGVLQPLRVARKVPESADVTSFYLTAANGQALPPFAPGQHLPVDLTLSATGGRASRTYSLSAPPDPGFHRITVKRESEGLVSRHLHDHLREGAIINAGLPAGDFVIRPGERPVVLVGAGVGVTPLVSMLGSLVAADDRREVWLVHGVRDGNHHPLAAEIKEIAARSLRAHAVCAYSRPAPADVAAQRFDVRGRVDVALLAATLPTLDADFYLCGPAQFISDLQTGLTQRSVPPGQIVVERFGDA